MRFTLSLGSLCGRGFQSRMVYLYRHLRASKLTNPSYTNPSYTLKDYSVSYILYIGPCQAEQIGTFIITTVASMEKRTENHRKRLSQVEPHVFHRRRFEGHPKEFRTGNVHDRTVSVLHQNKKTKNCHCSPSWKNVRPVLMAGRAFESL